MATCQRKQDANSSIGLKQFELWELPQTFHMSKVEFHHWKLLCPLGPTVCEQYAHRHRCRALNTSLEGSSVNYFEIFLIYLGYNCLTFDTVISLVPNRFTVLYEAKLFDTVKRVQISENLQWASHKDMQLGPNFSKAVIQINQAFQQVSIQMIWFVIWSCIEEGRTAF